MHKYGDKCDHRSKYCHIRDQIRFLKLLDGDALWCRTP